jgi:transposase
MQFAYPVELRDKAVKAYLKGKGTQNEIASILRMGLSTLGRYSSKYEKNGDLASKTHPGRPPMLGEGGWQRIQHWVEARPDIEFKELCALVEQELGKVVSEPTMCRACQALDLRRKKKSYYASEQAREDVKKASRFSGRYGAMLPRRADFH